MKLHTTSVTLLIFAAALGFGSAIAAPPATQEFGAPLELTTETPLAEVVAKADDWKDRTVLVRGRVADVCQRKGCWTILQAGEDRVRVRFKDYAFFVPTDSSGREALVEGVVEVKTISASMARHYEEESTGGNPAAVEGPRREIGITASGLRLLPEAKKES